MSIFLKKYGYCFILILAAFMSGCSEQSILDFERTIPSPMVLVKDGWQNFQPSWHPDGKQIVYVGRSMASAKGTHIRMVEVATKQCRTLFVDSTGAFFPKISPDGKRLLFVSNRSGSADLWCYHLSNSTFTRLTNLPGSESFPCWSPDGSRIAFLTQGRIAFTDTSASAPVFAQNVPFAAWSLNWSEENGSVIFSAFRDDAVRDQLLRYRIEEKKVVDILPEGIFGNWPACIKHSKNPLGSFIAYQDFGDPAGSGSVGGGISLCRLEDGTITRIVASGFSPAWSPDGLQLTYAVDGAIMLETIWVMMDD